MSAKLRHKSAVFLHRRIILCRLNKKGAFLLPKVAYYMMTN